MALHGGELQPELQPFPVARELLRRLYGELVITVVEYDPSWPERFGALRAEYAAAMAAARVPVKAIEHVGSTPVPGLAAKPVIDCDIVVGEADVTAASSVLVSLGFTPRRANWAFRNVGHSKSRNGFRGPIPT
jgi:GrpB-like predicted nucleotidyltransferase (UPF0157 family)